MNSFFSFLLRSFSAVGSNELPRIVFSAFYMHIHIYSYGIADADPLVERMKSAGSPLSISRWHAHQRSLPSFPLQCRELLPCVSYRCRRWSQSLSRASKARSEAVDHSDAAFHPVRSSVQPPTPSESFSKSSLPHLIWPLLPDIGFCPTFNDLKGFNSMTESVPSQVFREGSVAGENFVNFSCDEGE